MESETLSGRLAKTPPDQPVRVIIGAGDQAWDGWIATGRDDLDLTRPGDWAVFDARPADAFLCEHVFEHLTMSQARAAAKHIIGALVPGGRLRVAVPDGRFPDADYQRMVRVGGPGPADHPAADHKTVFTLDTLSQVLDSAGFVIDPLEYCDTAGRLHYHQWDWADGPIYRSLLSDHRNSADHLGFVSLIVDAFKPGPS